MFQSAGEQLPVRLFIHLLTEIPECFFPALQVLPSVPFFPPVFFSSRYQCLSDAAQRAVINLNSSVSLSVPTSFCSMSRALRALMPENNQTWAKLNPLILAMKLWV